LFATGAHHDRQLHRRVDMALASSIGRPSLGNTL
jgi:hypothetical protein